MRKAERSTERALNRSQADLRLLLDSAADGIYCVNHQGITTLCKQEPFFPKPCDYSEVAARIRTLLAQAGPR